MQCKWGLPAGGALRTRAPCSGCSNGRRLRLAVQAKIKYNANIAQNHSRRSVWVNIDYDRLYKEPSYNPGRLVGPVKLAVREGRGRGLVAQREIPMAEALLLCEPVGTALVAQEGRELLPIHLASALENMQAGGKLGAADRARLRLLYDGTPLDSPSSQLSRGASLEDFRKIEDKLRRANDGPKKAKGKGFGAPAPAAVAAAAAAASGIDTAALGEPLLTADELNRAVTYNSWGNSFGELGAAPLRKESSEAIIGVWPEFALLNHSCAPNTVAFSVGRLLLVQVVRDIPAGAEATTSYLGDLVTAPVAKRREWLRGPYGFECDCERCKAESSVPASVSAAVTAAYELASSDEAAALGAEAAGRSDRSSLAPLEAQLSAAVEALETSMEEAKLEEELRQWLRSSAYGAYFTLAVIRDLPDSAGRPGGLFGGGGAGGGPSAPFSDPAAPAQLAEMVKSVAPGSDLHLYLALEALSRSAEAYPRDDPRVAEATRSCLRGLIMRYGRVSDGMMQALLGARSRTQHYLGRITLASQQRPQDAGSALAGPLFGAASFSQVRQVADELASAGTA